MANAIRALAMDAVELAKSGHPGLPMGAADIATVLFTRFLKFDPADPAWPDRDRFVLSAGHGSMLVYALLYLLGYEKMTIDEIKRFRQMGSLTPGHPEYGHTPGIETTTGPLGQGIANAVGMAIAERHLAALFGGEIVDHTTYVLASDGDLMEGISQEAIALAGHLKLNKLIVLFDDNGISIDGPLALRIPWISSSASRPPAGRRRVSTATTPRRSPRRSKRRRKPSGRRSSPAAPRSASARRPRPAPRRATARRSAPTRSPAPGGRSTGARRLSKFRRPSARQWRSAGERGRPARLAWEARLAALDPGKARRVRAPPARRSHRTASGSGRCGEAKARGSAERDRNAIGFRIRARNLDRGAAGNDRRLGRPDRLQQYAHQGDEGDERGGLFRPLHPLRRARTRHGGGHERHGAAWRHRPLFRHLPGVLRLLPAGHSACGADGPARHPCHDARLDRARRGRTDASAGRASRRAARDPQSQSFAAVRHGRNHRVLAACAGVGHRTERAGFDAAKPAAAAPAASTPPTAARAAPTN